MTGMQILIYSMGASILFFTVAVSLGRKNIQPYHQLFAVAGVVITLASGLWLIYSVQVLHNGDASLAGIHRVDYIPSILVLIHRIVASLNFILMFAVVFTGLTKRLTIHRKLVYSFYYSFIVIYISGLIFFKG